MNEWTNDLKFNDRSELLTSTEIISVASSEFILDKL